MSSNDDNVSITTQTLGIGDATFIASDLGEPSFGTLDPVLTAIGSALSRGAAGGASMPTSGPFSTIYSFGDSLSDAGNISVATLGTIPVSPPYSDGRFTNGQVWVQDLAQDLGLNPLQPSLSGGTDFAFGGAQTGTTAVHTANPTDLPGQYAQFLSQDPNPSSNALYTVWIGSNDVLSILSQAGQTPANAASEISAAVSNEVSFIAALQAHGAKDVMVANVPDIGKTPDLMAEGAGASAAGSVLAQQYDGELSTALASLAATGGLKVDLIDTYGLLDGVIANPTAYGFTNATSPAWTGNFSSSSSGTLTATTAAAQNQHVFWDDLHPTAAAHALLAQYAASTIGTAFG